MSGPVGDGIVTRREQLLATVMAQLLAAHISKVGIITYTQFTESISATGMTAQSQLGELAKAIVEYAESQV